jgi:hypothetical protein
MPIDPRLVSAIHIQIDAFADEAGVKNASELTPARNGARNAKST